MAGRRVRWRNVGGVVCLAAAGVLIATHGSARRARPTAAPPPAPTGARRAPPPALRLAPLRDVPRLVLPRPRQRRALKGGDSVGEGGPRRVAGSYNRQQGKPPGRA